MFENWNNSAMIDYANHSALFGSFGQLFMHKFRFNQLDSCAWIPNICSITEAFLYIFLIRNLNRLTWESFDDQASIVFELESNNWNHLTV